ncbi:MAG: thioredoxin domain-containing protein [Hyphomonas sp.]
MPLKIIWTLLALATLGFGASAEPAVKVVNFSAKWCPLCRVLDPRIEEAVQNFSHRGVILVELDQTHISGVSEQNRMALTAQLQAILEFHDAAYLWDWYGGHAGIAVIIAADNGEPLACITTALSRLEIEDRLQESLILANRVRAGQRRPNGSDCPAPMNAGTTPGFD